MKADAIDISHWDGSDFQVGEAREQFGVSVLIVKGTEGLTKDPTFDIEAPKAKELGMGLGIYCYINATASGGDQYEYFRHACQGHHCIPILDYEIDHPDVESAAGDFIRAYRKDFPWDNPNNRLMIYGPATLVRSVDPGCECLFWIAEYPGVPASHPDNATYWHLWQYTESQPFNGGKVDLSMANPAYGPLMSWWPRYETLL